MHRVGLSNQPTSVSQDDGLRLTGAYLAAVNRCAPPNNKPTPLERDACLPFLEREIAALRAALGGRRARGVRLGRCRCAPFRARGHTVKPRPVFGHADEVTVGPYALLGCFHPSQQNTFTGTLTPQMLDGVFERAVALAG